VVSRRFVCILKQLRTIRRFGTQISGSRSKVFSNACRMEDLLNSGLMSTCDVHFSSPSVESEPQLSLEVRQRVNGRHYDQY
jgi:hypothetical protein